MKIIYATDKQRKDDGTIALVLPFGTMEIAIVVKANCVVLEGCAYLNPMGTRIFATAMGVAANIAEGNHVRIQEGGKGIT